MTRHELEVTFDDFCRLAFATRRFAPSSTVLGPTDPATHAIYAASSMLARPTLLSDNPAFPRVASSIHLDIVDRPEINAFACEYRGRPFIGIFRGTAERLFRTSLALACHPRILPTVGNVGELEPYARIRRDFDDANSWAEVTFDGNNWVPPALDRLDEKRLRLGVAVGGYALGFLLRHELAHVIRGHLNHAPRLHDGPLLLEVGSNINHEECLTHSAMEYDADKWSAVETAHYFDIFKGDDWRSSLDIFLLAIGMLFTLLDENREPVTKSTLTGYPHPSIRYLLVVSQAVRVCAEINNLRSDEVLADVAGFNLQTASMLSQVLSGFQYGIINEFTDSSSVQSQLAQICGRLTELESEFNEAVNLLASRW